MCFTQQPTVPQKSFVPSRLFGVWYETFLGKYTVTVK